MKIEAPEGAMLHTSLLDLAELLQLGLFFALRERVAPPRHAAPLSERACEYPCNR